MSISLYLSYSQNLPVSPHLTQNSEVLYEGLIQAYDLPKWSPWISACHLASLSCTESPPVTMPFLDFLPTSGPLQFLLFCLKSFNPESKNSK